MEKTKQALKQRRIWASIGAIIAFTLPIFGYNGSFDSNTFTDSILAIIQATSSLVAIFLPIWSYYKPKK